MRIGTGISGVDLTAQFNLAKAFNMMAESALKLSTLTRINRGSDDPAGLIAAEDLRAELTAIRAASDNAARARGIVHVADSALGEVNGLLNTVRGNIVAAAGGGYSDAEVAAMQLENDAALEAINRIGSYTSYGRRKLFDGSSGFQITGVNSEQVADIQVSQNAGGGAQTPRIEVTAVATTADLEVSDDDGQLDEAVTLQITGNQGTTTLEFSATATYEQVAQAVNANTDATGVTATVDGNAITFSSTDVGSDAMVSVEALEGSLGSGDTVAYGTDVVATVDGAEYVGQGNTISINSESLEAEITFVEGFEGEVDRITIAGDAMTFVFSPDVTNTKTIGMPTVNTASLGGAAGRLNELFSGGNADLTSGNLAQAMDILDAAGSQITSARAELGAFEKYTIDSSQEVLAGMELNISSARSQIFDTDVAAETSRWVKAQILAKTSIATMDIVAQRRSMVWSLLQGMNGSR